MTDDDVVANIMQLKTVFPAKKSEMRKKTLFPYLTKELTSRQSENAADSSTAVLKWILNQKKPCP